MGKIVSNFFISLDGVVESPDKWHFRYFNDEMGAAIGAGSAGAGAFLMGRRLYDEWSEFWPQQGPEVPFSEFINAVPKLVVSSSLTDPGWHNTTVLPGDADRVRKAKESVDGTLVMSGSATTVRWLLANGLLDELNLLVHPIVVGSGRRLFENTPTYPLRLVSQKAFQTGVLHTVYVPE